MTRRYDYNVDYMERLIDVAPAAAMRLSAAPLLSQYRTDPPGLWAGALLASTLDGDCGPCVQLCIDMALEQGVPAEELSACLDGNLAEAGCTGLGFLFAEKVRQSAPQADEYRDLIRTRYGERNLIATSFAAASGSFYPVLKRALGYGHACQAVQINGRTVRRQAA